MASNEEIRAALTALLLEGEIVGHLRGEALIGSQMFYRVLYDGRFINLDDHWFGAGVNVPYRVTTKGLAFLKGETGE